MTSGLMWDRTTAPPLHGSARAEQQLAEPQLGILPPEVKSQLMKCLAVRFLTHPSMYVTSLLADGKAEGLSPKGVRAAVLYDTVLYPCR